MRRSSRRRTPGNGGYGVLLFNAPDNRTRSVLMRRNRIRGNPTVNFLAFTGPVLPRVRPCPLGTKTLPGPRRPRREPSARSQGDAPRPKDPWNSEDFAAGSGPPDAGTANGMDKSRCPEELAHWPSTNRSGRVEEAASVGVGFSPRSRAGPAPRRVRVPPKRRFTALPPRSRTAWGVVTGVTKPKVSTAPRANQS
jgi:hypothetical protein